MSSSNSISNDNNNSSSSNDYSEQIADFRHRWGTRVDLTAVDNRAALLLLGSFCARVIAVAIALRDSNVSPWAVLVPSIGQAIGLVLRAFFDGVDMPFEYYRGTCIYVWVRYNNQVQGRDDYEAIPDLAVDQGFVAAVRHTLENEASILQNIKDLLSGDNDPAAALAQTTENDVASLEEDSSISSDENDDNGEEEQDGPYHGFAVTVRPASMPNAPVTQVTLINADTGVVTVYDAAPAEGDTEDVRRSATL